MTEAWPHKPYTFRALARDCPDWHHVPVFSGSIPLPMKKSDK